jgi:hypothetical protein
MLNTRINLTDRPTQEIIKSAGDAITYIGEAGK